MSNLNINKAQSVCLETYANGDFAHLLEIQSKDEFDTALAESGDTLLRFLMIELSTAEGCDSSDTAIRRMATAITDLTLVQEAIEELPNEDLHFVPSSSQGVAP